MRTIGFANKYYTLWEVSKPYKEQISEYEYREKQDFSYIKNLSMDLESAIKKVEGPHEIDLNLRGNSSFTRTGEVIDETPDNIFKFGKYYGEDINDVNDVEYTSWYYNQTENSIAKKLLLDNGYVEHEDNVISQDRYDELMYRKSIQDFIDSLDKGHFFNDGDRIELFLKEVESFSFEGTYGRTYVITYASKCGKLLKYMGSSPPNVSAEDYVKVLTTVKHNSYNGENETKVSRVKVL